MEKLDKVIIMGARGRDFFNFLEYYKYKSCRVVAFTASPQIAVMPNDTFPARLAGDKYPQGIPIRPESELEGLIIEANAEGDARNVIVNFAYSDVPSQFMKTVKDKVEELGAKFEWAHIIAETMIKSSKPVIAVTAVRTGCGKSALTRYVLRTLEDLGKKAVAVRHPMPYGDLNNSDNDVQKFASYDDLSLYNCTFEEREEYEPIINAGRIVYAGIDYRKVLRQAEKEADVIVWDGGNNDAPFYKPDLWITLVDPHRPGDEMNYPHGRYNLKNADVVVVGKVGSADEEDLSYTVGAVLENRRDGSIVCAADLDITLDSNESIKGKRVIAIEDGPTLTHGGMSYGAAVLAAKKYGCELVDPLDYAIGHIKDTFNKYPHLKGAKLLPNMGYSLQEVNDLEWTIDVCASLERVDCLISGTPIDLSRVIDTSIPIVQVGYEFKFLTGGGEDEFIKALRGAL